MIALAARLFLALAAAPANPAVEVFVVTAGNNRGLADEPLLRYAESDAGHLADVLTQLGGASPHHVVRSLGQDAQGLRGTLLEMNARIRSLSSEKRRTLLVVFYSGHADAQGLHLGESLLPFEELKAMVAGSPATTRLLIMDACRSGGAIQVKGARPAEEFAVDGSDPSTTEGFVIITSSASGEDSYESDRLRSSFFSHHLLTGLSGAADRNGDGLITLTEVYHYAYEQTLRSSGRTANLQHPTYLFDLKGKGQLILTRLENDRQRSGALWLPKTGLYLIRANNEEGAVAAEVAVGESGASILLPAGRYFVQKRGRDSFQEAVVELHPGIRMDLDTQPIRVVEYARLLRKGGGERRLVHGIFVLGAARGGLLAGQGASPQLLVGSALDLRWLSLGLRGRFGWNQLSSREGPVVSDIWEGGLGISLQRFIDLRWFSLALGLLFEGSLMREVPSTPGQAPTRTAFVLALGALASFERDLGNGFYLCAEGGPLTHLFSRGETRAGAQVGSQTETVLTWWMGGGVGWRFR